MEVELTGALEKGDLLALPSDEEHRLTKKVTNRYSDLLEEGGVLHEDVVVIIEGDMSKVNFLVRIQGLMVQEMQRIVIVRLLGKELDSEPRTQGLWRCGGPQGHIKITNLDNDFFLLRLAIEKDYEAALLNAPWTVITT